MPLIRDRSIDRQQRNKENKMPGLFDTPKMEKYTDDNTPSSSGEDHEEMEMSLRDHDKSLRSNSNKQITTNVYNTSNKPVTTNVYSTVSSNRFGGRGIPSQSVMSDFDFDDEDVTTQGDKDGEDGSKRGKGCRKLFNNKVLVGVLALVIILAIVITIAVYFLTKSQEENDFMQSVSLLSLNVWMYCCCCCC